MNKYYSYLAVVDINYYISPAWCFQLNLITQCLCTAAVAGLPACTHAKAIKSMLWIELNPYPQHSPYWEAKSRSFMWPALQRKFLKVTREWIPQLGCHSYSPPPAEPGGAPLHTLSAMLCRRIAAHFSQIENFEGRDLSAQICLADASTK